MIIVKNSIVSDDIAECRFCCDLALCHGACCVEGDAGAPVLTSEVEAMQALLPAIMPMLSDESRHVLDAQGVAVDDGEGGLATPLCSDARCAYLVATPAGDRCAFQLLPPQSQLPVPFPKPVSCHLYPIRVEDYGQFTAVNYHRWDVCRHAQGHGPLLYELLREPLLRRFGAEWYDELLQEISTHTPQ